MSQDKFERLLQHHFPDRSDDWFASIRVGTLPSDADHGARAILKGVKTLTATLPWEWQDEREPFVNALSVVVDGKDEPVAIVETVRVERIRFADVTDDMALAYGEGERSLLWWREHMGSYYHAYAQQAGQEFDSQSTLLFETIRVVANLGRL
ncbi:MAG: ASCH domain-containing protein [Anderseniella sp.]